MLARPARGADKVDLARAIAQPSRPETAIAAGPPVAASAANVRGAPIEPGAPIRLRASAAILDQQTRMVKVPDAVDDLGDARNLIEPGGDRLRLAVFQWRTV